MAEDLVLRSRIRERESGTTLLEFLAGRFTYHSEAEWRERIAAGAVVVNGRAAGPDELLAEGDLVTYTIAGFREPAVDTRVETVLETPELFLVGKPAGTPVTRSGLIVHNTLVNIVRRRWREEVHPLHRIDRETSGLVLFGRNKEVCRRYQSDLGRIILGKYYLAVVHGAFPGGRTVVDLPLGPREDSEILCRMWPGEGKPCLTVFHCLAAAADRSLVLAELKTGRRHQIRAHLAHLGHPVVGDKIYTEGGRYFLKKIESGLDEADLAVLGARNHLLHAWCLEISLPEGRRRFFSKLFSEDFRYNLERFPGWRNKAKEIMT